MSNIVACYKWVADEADLKIAADLSVDASKAKGKISDYDRNAIEAAMQIAALTGDKPVTLTFGNAKTKQSLKDALSRGPKEGYWINADEADQADGAVTAKALTAAIRKIGDVQLVICAEGASDTYARQTAPRIAAELDWPLVSSVSELSIAGRTITATRKLDDCLEIVQVDLPAVIAVLPEANQPTIPGLKAVMEAGKKPMHEIKGSDLGIDYKPLTQVRATKGFVMNRKNILLEGAAADQVKELAAALRKEGVL